MTTITEDTYTSREARLIVGCSHRVLDYFVRCDLIHPACGPAGSGSRMAWGQDDVRILAVFVALRRLGALHATLQPLEAALRALPEHAWAEVHVITVEGTLSDPEAAEKGWLLDFAALTTAVDLAA